MTLTLELSRETETWLQTEAAKQGVDPGEYARRLIESKQSVLSLPDIKPVEKEEAERLAAIDAAMGAFAYVSTSSEEFARRKQEETDIEEAKFARK